MSKSVRAAIAIAILLVIVSAASTVWFWTQNRSLTQQYQNLQAQLTDSQNKLNETLLKAKKSEDDAAALTDKIKQNERDRAQLDSANEELKRKAEELESQIEQAHNERDDWKGRVETIRRERDGLMQKLKARPKEVIVYKDRPVQNQEAAANSALSAAIASAPSVNSAQGDEYWAQILKQKAALQIELDKAKNDLDKSALQIGELKKQNSDLQLEIKDLTNTKEDIVRKIKYGEDLANNLSIELARSRNDQKFVNDRADKVKEENLDLQAQIKQLTTTKVTLEKTIARLSDEKEKIQNKLVETESVIQGRIDEIWKIKDSVDQKLTENNVKSNQMDLPPIIVNASAKGAEQAPAVQAATPTATVIQPHRSSVISINEANNFVITDLGQDSGVKVGGVLKVYRAEKEIATLEVIQVRKDICAADIKNKVDALRVGDVVKPVNI